MMNYRIEAIDNPGDAQCEAVNLLLRTHNQCANPEFWAARERVENRPVAVGLFVIDGQDRIIGGLFGSTQFAWLKVDVMAVNGEWRGRGVGRALLNKAETIARERGCRHAYVDTMDYQAPGFYQKLGYAIAGILEDWDSFGHSKYFLVKSL
jgi:GNAT superfamily N-acetyltransferase